MNNKNFSDLLPVLGGMRYTKFKQQDNKMNSNPYLHLYLMHH